ncbi:hypothetical protein [Desulfovermiculus halophilus]|uniref:hypothetical protein n=1 Tax=Desulfovermiculus halophilus TaxID=339722 RepID=UPI0004801336|nr:hypothetical protein [Desulfovermiculus halophilus]
MPTASEITGAVVNKALSLGADIAGVAGVDALRGSPSHLLYPKIGSDLDTHWPDGDKRQEVAWPAEARSVVVIGVSHPEEKPEMDWWDGKGTSGNRILMRINRDLSAWVETSFACRTWKMPYLIEKGGIFLKDAAVMAGLGCVGSNNLVITPRFGARVRFRALLLSLEAQPTGPVTFDPCQGCEQFCRRACPVDAFAEQVYSSEIMHQSILPGTDGSYDRVVCNQKMGLDIDEAVQALADQDEEQQALRTSIDAFESGTLPGAKDDYGYAVKYCRLCELGCPVGNEEPE